MGLLQANAMPPEDQEEPMEDEATENETPEMESEEGAEGTLTITADAVAEEVKKNVEPDMWDDVKQAVNAGMKLLFDKKSHDTLFDSIRPEDEVPLEDELGAGATNLMMMMVNESQGTMPGEIVIPVGTILLAKVCEFINETKMAPVTDETFSEAWEIFQVNIQDKLNPRFREENGLQPKEGQAEGNPLPSGQPEASPPPSAPGLLGGA